MTNLPTLTFERIGDACSILALTYDDGHGNRHQVGCFNEPRYEFATGRNVDHFDVPNLLRAMAMWIDGSIHGVTR